ncbi:MAG TPA: HAMP domain-containing sensor histidine kinase [Streptosporangiaceae bacterium]
MSVLRARLSSTPLWVRLVAGTLLLVALALLVTGFVGTRLLHGYLLQRVDDQLGMVNRLQGPVLSRLGAGGIQPREVPRPDSGRSRFPGMFYAVILDPSGRVTEVLGEPLTDRRPKLPVLMAADVKKRQGRPFSVSGIGSGAEWRVVTRQLRDGRGVVLAVSLADIESTVSRLMVIDAAAGAVVLGCLGVAGYLLVRMSLRPLVKIEKTAETIAAGDLSRRVPDRAGPGEVTRLGRALNGMLAQIESAFHARATSEAAARGSEERMRRFVADAGHELRTPLTMIRGFAELYRQEGGGDANAARLLRRIEDAASRMGLLVDDLLLLAHMDRQRPIELGEVDLLSVAAEAVLDARHLAPDREIDLVRLDGGDRPVTVVGDEARLRQVVGNLVSNALTHTPEGTPFRVGVGLSRRGAVVEVADEGPGLPADQAERVFERFYRADKSRSRANGGNGLGLSIVAALVHAHGGLVELETAPGSGATFRVLLHPADGGIVGSPRAAAPGPATAAAIAPPSPPPHIAQRAETPSELPGGAQVAGNP